MNMVHIKEFIDHVKDVKDVAMGFGMKFLDENIGGLYPGELTVICGDANCGKTAVMIRQIHHLAVEKKVSVMMVLNGMSERTFLACMTAYYCSIFTKDARKVFADPRCHEDVENYMKLLHECPIYIMERHEFEMIHDSQLREFVKENGIQAIFVECMGFFCESSIEQKYFARRLKLMAKNLNITIVGEYHFFTNEDYPALSIRQFENNDVIMFADNIIGIIDFQHHGIKVDEKGNDLRGKVRLKIIKHKGVMSEDKDVIVTKMRLFVRSNSTATYIDGDRESV